jgi:hypothetical protein
MIIELGYITLFASAFPLAPLLSFVCNLIETKSDIYRLVYITRKPPSVRRSTIGVWFFVQIALAWVSILTNCLIFGFSSNQLARWVPDLYNPIAPNSDAEFKSGYGRYAVGIVFALDQILMAIVVGILVLTPSKPQWVCDKKLRKSFLSKLHRTGGKRILNVNYDSEDDLNMETMINIAMSNSEECEVSHTKPDVHLSEQVDDSITKTGTHFSESESGEWDTFPETEGIEMKFLSHAQTDDEGEDISRDEEESATITLLSSTNQHQRVSWLESIQNTIFGGKKSYQYHPST